MISSIQASVFLALVSVLAQVDGAVLEPRRGALTNAGSLCVLADCATTSSVVVSSSTSSSLTSSTTASTVGVDALTTEPVLSIPGLVVPTASSESSTTSVSEIATTSAPASITSSSTDSPVLDTTSFPTLTNATGSGVWSNTSTSTAANPDITAGLVLVGVQIVGDTSSTTAKPTTKAAVVIVAPPPKAAVTSITTSDLSTSTSLTAVNVTILAITSSSSSVYLNATTTSWSNSTVTTLSTSTSTEDECVTLSPGEIWTTYSILPNTTTTTETITLGVATTFSTTPEFTPPVLCPSTASRGKVVFASTTAIAYLSSARGVGPTPTRNPVATTVNTKTVTAIITSKNGVTVYTTVTPPGYYGETDAKVTVIPTKTGGGKVGISVPPVSTTPKKTVEITLSTTAEAALAAEASVAASTVTSVAADGVTVVVSPSDVVIGSQSVVIGSSTQLVTASGVVYTIDASHIVGPSLTVNVPITSVARVASAAPAATTTAPATNIVILDPEPFSIIGSSVVVLGSSTITYGPGVTYAAGLASTTSVVNGEVITVGPSGVSYDGTTLGGTAHASGTQIGLAGGLTITEVGSTLAVINGVTLTIGPSASAYTTVISGHTITADSHGLGLGGTTLSDFNPTTVAVTAGGVTFTEIGSTLAVIGGTTYTFGGNAKPTTTVINGQTVSFGPSGIGFATTTFVSYSPTATATGAGSAASASTTGKKSSGKRVSPVGTAVMFVVVCVAYMI